MAKVPQFEMGSTRAYDADYFVESHGSGCLRFFRALLMGMNILLTAGAVAGLAVGLLERSAMEATLDALCQSCHQMFVAYTSVFSALLGFSLLGFFALYTRNILLRVLYFIYLSVVFFGALSISIAHVFVSTNRVNLETGWNRAAVDSAEGLCSLELQLRCSGWKVLCNTSGAGSMPLLTRGEELPVTVRGEGKMYATAALPLAAHAEYGATSTCPTCSEKDQKEINGYTNTCESVVVGSIKEHLKDVLPIGLSIAGAALLGMIVTCLLQREKTRDASCGGRYYRV